MRAPLLAVALLAVACGNLPTEEEREDAKARVQGFLDAADKARVAAELLGLVPVYTCGEPRASFVGEAVDALEAKLACATVAHEAQPTADLVHVTFPTEGCALNEVTLTGRATLQYSGGEDLFELEGDFRETVVNGEPLQAKAGYGTCSDEKRYWVLADGTLGDDGRAFTIDARLAARAGLPIIGGTTLVLDGTGSLEKDAKTDQMTFEALVYDVGDYLPQEGTLVITTSEGRTVKATFSNTLWKLGKVELTVDDSEPVTVPILQ